MDWGYSRPFAVQWWAVDRDRRMYLVREFYGCTGTPNVGLMMEPTEVAIRIKQIEDDDPNLHGRTIHRVGDPAIWGTQGGESIGALFERQRVYFEKGDHNRIQGKMQLHHRLAFDEEGAPLLYVFNTCKHFIRTVPALVYSESNVEDIDTDGEDHHYDSCRYCLMKNPIAAPVRKNIDVKPYDPLDIDWHNSKSQGRYEFYRRY